MTKVVLVNGEGTITKGLLKGQKGLVVSYDSELDELGIKLSDGYVYELTSEMVNQEPEEQLTLNLDENKIPHIVDIKNISLDEVFMSQKFYPSTWNTCIKMALRTKGKKYIEFNRNIFPIDTPYPLYKYAICNLEDLKEDE